MVALKSFKAHVLASQEAKKDKKKHKSKKEPKHKKERKIPLRRVQIPRGESQRRIQLSAYVATKDSILRMYG